MDLTFLYLPLFILGTSAQFRYFGRSYTGPRAAEVPRLYNGRGTGQYPRRAASATTRSDRGAAYGGVGRSYPQGGSRYQPSNGYNGNRVETRPAYSGRTWNNGQREGDAYSRRTSYARRGNSYANPGSSSWRESGGRGRAQRNFDQGRSRDPRGSSYNDRQTTISRRRSYDNRGRVSYSDSFGSRPLNTLSRGETFQRRNGLGDRNGANSGSGYSFRPNGYRSNTNTAYSRNVYRNSPNQRARGGNQYSRNGNRPRPVQRQTTYQNYKRNPNQNSRSWQSRSNGERSRRRDNQPRYRQQRQPYVQRELPNNGHPQSTTNVRQTQQVASNYRNRNEPLYGQNVRRQAKSGARVIRQPGQSRRQSTGLNSPTGHNSLRTPRIDTLVREVDNSFPPFRGERNEAFQYRAAVQRTPGRSGSSRRGDFTGEPVSSLQLPFERLSLRYPNFVETQRKKLQEKLRSRPSRRHGDVGRRRPPGLDLLGRRYDSPVRSTPGETVHVVIADVDNDKTGLASSRDQLIAEISRTLGMAEQLQIDLNSLGDPDWTVQPNTAAHGSSVSQTGTVNAGQDLVNFIFIDKPLLSDFKEAETNVASIKLATNNSNTSVVGYKHLANHQPFFLESGNDGVVPIGDDKSSLLSTQVQNGD